MKFCMLTTSYPRYEGDDAGIFVERLAEALAEVVDKVSVIAPHDHSEPLYETKAKIEIKRVRFATLMKRKVTFGAGIVPNIRQSPCLALQLPILGINFLRSLVRDRSRYDFVLANWLFCGFVSCVARIVTKRDYLYIVRGVEAKFSAHWIGKMIFKAVISRSRYTICVSPDLAQELKGRFPSLHNKIVHIPNGVKMPDLNPAQIETFRERMNFTLGQKFLLFVGTIVPRKNVAWLIELLDQPELSSYQLLLCGRLHDNDYVSHLRTLIEQKGMEDRVILLGEVLPSDVPFYLKLCSAYISASLNEGTPNSVLEALAMGAIVFASNIPAHRDIIIDEQNGFLLSLDSPSQAARKVSFALNNQSDLCNNISEAAKTSMVSRTWERSAAQYTKLLR